MPWLLAVLAACASPDLSPPCALNDVPPRLVDAAGPGPDDVVADLPLSADVGRDPGLSDMLYSADIPQIPDAIFDGPGDPPDAFEPSDVAADPGGGDVDAAGAPPLVCAPWTRPVVGDLVDVESDSLRVTVHHVRFREDEGPLGGAWHDHPDYPFWQASGHDITSRTAMFLAEPWRPDPAAVTDVVLLAAGQQGIREMPGAFANIATGQMDDWRPPNPNKVRDADVRVRRESVAGRILEDGILCSGVRYGFAPGSTLVLLAFDAGYNYMLSPEYKQSAVDGYLDWISARIGDPARLRRVFVAGSSRGGCLALRIAEGMLDDPRYAGARVLLGTLDGVCRPEQAEGGTTTVSPIPNPLHPEWKAFRTDLAAFLPQAAHDRVAVRQIVGAGPVIDLHVAGIAHAFVDTHVDAPLYTWPFDYAMSWVDLPHNEIGRPWRDETAGALLSWLEAHGASTAAE